MESSDAELWQPPAAHLAQAQLELQGAGLGPGTG